MNRRGTALRRHNPSSSISRFRCDNPILAQDDFGFQSAKSAFIRAKKLVKRYGAQLRKIARHVDDIVKGFDPTTPHGQAMIQASLLRYGEMVKPWAEAEAERLVNEVSQSDKASWKKVSAEIGRAIHKEIETAPTGAVMRRIQDENVHLITSLPREAAERVQRVAREGIAKGMRADTLAKKILVTGHVTKSRADLIAKTEVGRASTALTQARAEHIGSDGYVWRTSKDGDVRASHRAMEGKFVRWDSPPTLDKLTGHAGALPNCRCYCQPTIPD